MHCRRCQSLRLVPLEKKQLDDNDVFRCGDCGYLFSPSIRPQPSLNQGIGQGIGPRTTAVESGYPAQS
jgi:hypothetical protein